MERSPQQTPTPALDSEGTRESRGLRAICKALRSDLKWIFREGPTPLEKATPLIPTLLNWCTSFANFGLFFKPGSRRRKNYKDLYAGFFAVFLTGLLWGWRLIPTYALGIVA